MGKKIIEMKKIENRQSLQVTFSKRRKGLFKKAAKLSLPGGYPMLAIAFSPGGKPFSFGVGDDGLIGSFFSGNFGNGVVGGAADLGERQTVAAGGSAVMHHDGGDDSDGDDLMNAVTTDGEGSSTDDAWMYQFDADNCNNNEELQHFIARADERQGNERRCSNHIPAAVVPQSAIEANGGWFEMIDSSVAVCDTGLLETGGETHAYMHTGVEELQRFIARAEERQSNERWCLNPIPAAVMPQSALEAYGGCFQEIDNSVAVYDTGLVETGGETHAYMDTGFLGETTGFPENRVAPPATIRGARVIFQTYNPDNGVFFDGVGLPEYNGSEADPRMMMQTACPSALAIDTRNAFFMENMLSMGGDDLMINAVATDGEGRSTDDAWMYQFDADNGNSIELHQRFIARAEERQSNERHCSDHIPAAVVSQSAIKAYGGCFPAIDNVAVYDAGLLETGGETHAHVHTGLLGETTGFPENRVAPLASITAAGVVFHTYNPENGVSFDGIGLPECNGREADSRMMMQTADPSPLAADTRNAFFMEDMSSQIDWGAIDAPVGGDHLTNAVATAGQGCSTDDPWMDQFDADDGNSIEQLRRLTEPAEERQNNENGVSFDGLGSPESNGREADSRTMIQSAAPSALAVDTRNTFFMEDMSSQIGGGGGVVAQDTDDWLLDEDFVNRLMSGSL